MREIEWILNRHEALGPHLLEPEEGLRLSNANDLALVIEDLAVEAQKAEPEHRRRFNVTAAVRPHSMLNENQSVSLDQHSLA